LLRAKEIALANGKRDVHRILADDRRKYARLRTDYIPLGDACAADLSDNGGVNVGVAEIDLSGLQVRLRFQDGACGLLVRRQRLVSRHDSARIRRQQLLGAFELNLCENLCRLRTLECALRLFDSGVEQSSFDAVQRSAVTHCAAFLENDFFYKAG